MRITDRYIAWQVLYGTIFGVSLLTGVLILGQLFKKIRSLLVEQAAPLELIGQFILLIVPYSLIFALPWGFLGSTLLNFGRLSRHSELLSLRMAGLSLTRVALPTLIAGAGLSALCWWLAGTAAPRAKGASKDLIYETVKKNPRKLIEPGVVISRFKDQRVYAEGKDENGVIQGLHIYVFDSDDRDAGLETYMYADLVDLYVNEEEKQLRLKLTNPFIEVIPDEEGAAPIPIQAEEMEPVLINFSATSRRISKPTGITNSDAPARILESQERQELAHRELAGEIPPRPAGLPPEANYVPEVDENGDAMPIPLTSGRIDELETAIQREDRFQKSMKIELHKRRSLSLACLSFAFIGIPLGISPRRRENSNGLLLSLLIAATYFGFLIFAEELENASLSTIVAALWLPNFLCLGLGIWLFRKASFR